MTRPRKATVDYFPHDVTHGKTLYILESHFGNDGYATWFKILERLGASDGHYIDLRDKASMLHLSAYCRVSAEALMDILSLLSDLGAIDRDLWRGNVVFSGGLVHRVTDAYRKRINNLPTKESITKSLNLVYPAETIVSDAEKTVSGVGNPQREREREREREIDSKDDGEELRRQPSKSESQIRGSFKKCAAFLSRKFPHLDLEFEEEQCVAKYRDKSPCTQPDVRVMEWCKRAKAPEIQPDGSPPKSKAQEREDATIAAGQEAMRLMQAAKEAQADGSRQAGDGGYNPAGGGIGRAINAIEDHRVHRSPG